jgi:tetratricopeptide (TPR) repeat protein
MPPTPPDPPPTPPLSQDFSRLVLQAQKYRQEKEYLKEISTLIKALDYDPKNYRILVTIALAFGRLGCNDDALNYINEALRINPDYHKAYNSLGNLFRTQGELGKALECYESAIERFPHNFSIHYNRAITAMDLLMYPEAIDSFLTAYHLDPTETTILRDLGDIYYRIQKGEDALKMFSEYLEKSPDATDSNQIRNKIKTIKKKLDL